MILLPSDRVSCSTSISPFSISAPLGEAAHFQRHACPRPGGEFAFQHGHEREELEMPIKQKTRRAWLKGRFCSETDNVI